MKSVIVSAASIVGTLLLTAVVSYFLGVFERGSQAASEDEIREVLKEEMVTIINGETKTYGQALSLMNERQVRMEQALGALVED